jgi:2-polyprenyl-6-methoxyphenol hydroxylase-like FAD-dependent oxidoreductase
MKVLISGAGIAGPALAWWLDRYGFEPTIVETAPQLRRGGYVIDFWGAGFDIAERMGLVPELTRRGYRVREVRVAAADGKPVVSFAADAFSRMTQGRFVSLPRGELAAAIYEPIQERVETLFGDSIQFIEETGSGVEVAFRSGHSRTFDLVVGADGLHSQVRRLVFGNPSGERGEFEKYLGYKAAAFEVPGYRPRDELVYVMYTEVGQQVARFALRDDRTMFLFTFRDPDPGLPSTLPEQKALLRGRFGQSGWECPQILDALDGAGELYLDRVSQIHMEARPGLWSQGRVTLLGDAAFCVSLLAGQGSALAMVAASILAAELRDAAGDYTRAFARYQERFAPFVLKKQKAALRFASFFAPPSRLALHLRNQGMRLMRIPFLAEFLAGRDLADRIALRES